MGDVRYYHGGVPGRRMGDTLTGGNERRIHEGCVWCEARAAGKDTALDPPSHRPDKVYVTTDREYARFYASLYGYGDLYRVEPIGPLEPSSEDHFDAYTADAVRVAGIVASAVRLTWGQRRRMYRRWEAADFDGTPLALLFGGAPLSPSLATDPEGT